jgi:integrase
MNADRRVGPETERVLRQLQGAYSTSTIRQCRNSLQVFEAWCAARGLTMLPAEPATLAGFVDALFESSARSTVLTRLWCVRVAHRILDLPDPGLSHPVRMALRRGSRRTDLSTRPAVTRQAWPVNAEVRDRLLAVCPDTPMGVRDRALLRLGYDTLCRQGELVRLRIEDIDRLPDGGARILVQTSKNDPFGRGEYVYARAPALASVDRWLALARLDRGPILRHAFRVRPGQAELRAHAVRRRLKALARAAGFPETAIRTIGGHSMRVGAAHDLAVNGASLAQIMRAGRWRSLESAAHYMREAPVNVWSALEAMDGAGRSDPAGLALAPAGAGRGAR